MKEADHTESEEGRKPIGTDGPAVRKVHVDTGGVFPTTWMDLFMAAFPSWTEEELEKNWENLSVFTDEDRDYVLMCNRKSQRMGPKGDPTNHGMVFWLSVGGGKVAKACLRREGRIERVDTQFGTVHVFKLPNGAVVAQLQTRKEGTLLERIAVRHELFEDETLHWFGDWGKQFNSRDKDNVLHALQHVFDHVTP